MNAPPEVLGWLYGYMTANAARVVTVASGSEINRAHDVVVDPSVVTTRNTPQVAAGLHEIRLHRRIPRLGIKCVDPVRAVREVTPRRGR